MEGAIAKKNSLVFTTLSSSYPDRLISQGFKPDLVIMDEAGQVLECATWPMLLQVNKKKTPFLKFILSLSLISYLGLFLKVSFPFFF